MEQKTYKILSSNLLKLENAFKALQKKAKKLGLTPPSFEVVKYIPEYWDKLNTPPNYYPARYEITVTGEFPKIDGWNFLAAIDHLENGNIIRSFKEVDLSYSSSAPNCDHCQKNRYRKHTFLVVNQDTQEIKQIGKSCVKDYLGGRSPEQLAYLATFLKTMFDLESDEDVSIHPSVDFSLVDFLSAAVQVVEEDGRYISRKNSEYMEPTTSDKTIVLLNSDVKVEEKSLVKALEILDFLQNYNPKNSYESNLVILSKEFVAKRKNYGLIASMVPFFQRNQEEQKTKEVKEEVVSNYVFEEKQRVEMNLTLDKVMLFDNMFGTVFFHIFSDKNGNKIVWKTNTGRLTKIVGGIFTAVEDGEAVKCKATVKKHSEYKGIKQTEVSRLALIEEVQSESHQLS